MNVRARLDVKDQQIASCHVLQ